VEAASRSKVRLAPLSRTQPRPVQKPVTDNTNVGGLAVASDRFRVDTFTHSRESSLSRLIRSSTTWRRTSTRV
jgi:hypothetical protein